MSSATKYVANAVGGKTARACDSCITKRARWYCAADDAFLCQACDSSVHSANSLARRHERVRLKTASYKSTDEQPNCAPSWHTKKARTPRHGKHSRNSNNTNPFPFHLVPEVVSDEVNSHEENEEQLLYRVPIFDPFVGELCSSSPPSSNVSTAEVETKKGRESNNVVLLGCENQEMEGLLPSDVELAEFAADVESLLGRGLENEYVGMEELGLIDAKVEEESPVEEVACKVEADQVDMSIMVGTDQSFDFTFHYDTCQDLREKKVDEHNDDTTHRNKISLQLDYEAVIDAWSAQKSPWTTGHRPDFDPHHCWPQCMGTCGTELHQPYGELGGFGCHPVMTDGGREARVSRYREKRRTRLFSKKIRYEVRKLNAEKRPRMKGRFVKRASFPAPTFPLLNK
ncbi:hypothetical protein VNO77_12105 [Canavalia gladiata]|uniref:Zinc finger protein CONSTANS-LIKE 16 n=1 Tax=Canavalia gladiata TaxID=3824 RepID=A0AAN9QU77_CANGL